MPKVTIINSRYDEGEGSDIILNDNPWEMIDLVVAPSDLKVNGFHAYRKREDACIGLLQDICREFGQDHVIVASPVVLRPPAAYLGEFRNGSLISLDLASRLAKSMLRGGAIFGCAFRVPGVSLRVDVGPGWSLFIEAEDEIVALIRSRLPTSLIVTGQAELPDEYISTPVNNAFWNTVMQDGIDSGRPIWIQERWAQGKYGERWFLVDSSAISAVKSTFYNNSAICAGAIRMPIETVSLPEVFDEINADSADELDLLVLSEPAQRVPYRVAVPLDARLLAREPISSNDPARIVYPGKFRVEGRLEPGERLWEGVTPDLDGRLCGRWLGLTIPGA